MFIKRFLIGYFSFFFFVCILTSCSDSPTVSNENHNFNTVSTELPENGAELVLKDVVEVNSSTEVIDSITYVTKDYAHLKTSEKYFYTYYRVYYLNNKIRRIHVWEHGVGSCLNYSFDSFVEHRCAKNNSKTIYTYYDNGNPEFKYYISDSIFSNSPEIYKMYLEETHFRSNGLIEFINVYYDSVINASYQYYENGLLHSYATYTLGVESSRKEYEYYETERIKKISHYNNSTLSSYTLYDEDGKKIEMVPSYQSTTMYRYSYYPSGNMAKTEEFHSNSIYEEVYYYDYPERKKAEVQYSNSEVIHIWLYYISGRYSYIWYGDKLRIYEDLDGNPFSEQDYSLVQALALLNTFVN